MTSPMVIMGTHLGRGRIPPKPEGRHVCQIGTVNNLKQATLGQRTRTRLVATRQCNVWDTYTTEKRAMLLDLSNDVSVVEQLGENQRSLVTNLQSLGLKNDLLLTLCTNHLASNLPLLYHTKIVTLSHRGSHFNQSLTTFINHQLTMSSHL